MQGYELLPETLAQDVLTKNVPTAGIAVVDDEISCTELKSVLDVINSRTAETNYRETCESGVRNASLHLRNPRFYRPVAR